MNQLNLDLFQWMAAGPSPTPWVLWIGLQLAQYGAWLCLAIMLWAGWRRPAARGRVTATLALCGLASIVAHGIAAHYKLPRPFTLGLSPEWLFHGDRGTLPSTHATVMAVAILMFLLKRGLRPLAIPLGIVAALACWARIYVGVHFPLDMAAGVLLAGGLVAVAEGAWALTHHHLAQQLPHDHVQPQHHEAA